MFKRRRRDSDEEHLSLLFDVTEDLVRQFGNEVPRLTIQQCVLQALVEQADVRSNHDLRGVVTSLATFRVMSEIESGIESPAEPAG